MLAAIRPDDWNFPLLVHVFGALTLVGSIGTALAFQYAGWRRVGAEARAFARLGFRTLLFAALPAWVIMRVGAQWIYDREGFTGDDEPAWLGIGYIVADPGGLVLLLSIVLAGFAASRVGRPDAAPEGGRPLARVATVLATLALVAYVIAIWAMSAKPD